MLPMSKSWLDCLKTETNCRLRIIEVTWSQLVKNPAGSANISRISDIQRDYQQPQCQVQYMPFMENVIILYSMFYGSGVLLDAKIICSVIQGPVIRLTSAIFRIPIEHYVLAYSMLGTAADNNNWSVLILAELMGRPVRLPGLFPLTIDVTDANQANGYSNLFGCCVYIINQMTLIIWLARLWCELSNRPRDSWVRNVFRRREINNTIILRINQRLQDNVVQEVQCHITGNPLTSETKIRVYSLRAHE